MNSAEIRQRFLNFFHERGHQVLPSSSLIPFDDPTLLLTTAGMVQFKPYFLGQKEPPHRRVTTVQKSFRTVDIELVGHDGHHNTFFEMLGNFAFGDYFKEKAIPYAYELLTEHFGIPAERLWAGIHQEDDESFDIWTGATAMPASRIRRFGDDYNFWAAGPTGPCGPDSEIHYDWGSEYGCGRPDCGPNCEHCDRFLEVWNLVFMQWDRDESGRRSPLRRKGIDTGMGLERLTSVLTGRRSLYDTDLFRPLIGHWERVSGRLYGDRPESDISLRVLADHGRGATMLIADGLTPSNEGRGYVLRRLIRRGMLHARRLGSSGGLSGAVPVVDEIIGHVYPELHTQTRKIAEVLLAEEERFAVSLRQGMERLTGLLDRGTVLPEEAFYLHDTLGFPIELTAELARERGVAVDLEAVNALMQGQRDKSRGSAGFVAPPARSASRFVGYEQLAADTTIAELFPVPDQPEQLDVFLAETPFYAERGGQAADRGELTWEGGRATVLDVQAQGEAIRHRVRLSGQAPEPGQAVHAAVDAGRRGAIARHHSATHLLHRSLRDVLGEEATQAGSAVQEESASFDFRFPRALTPKETRRVGELLNERIRADLKRRVDVLPLQEAIASGAVALFDEKYGDTVRVVSFGDWARELCGGTHVERSGEIGMALLTNDRSIGAGVRRIEIRAGQAADAQVRLYEDALGRLGQALRGTPSELPGRVEALQADLKRLEKEVQQLKERLAAGGSAAVQRADVDGVTLLLQQVDPKERDLLLYADHALTATNGRGIALIVAGRSFAVKVATGLVDRVPAADVVRAVIEAAGGKGGGRGPVGQGGGIDPARIPLAFEGVQAYLRERLGAG